MPKKWTEKTIRPLLKKGAFKSRNDFKKANRVAYEVARVFYPKLLDEFLPPSRSKYALTLEKAIAMAAACQNRLQLKRKSTSAYNLLKAHNLLDKLLPKHREPANDDFLDRVLNDPFTRIYPDGSLYTCRRTDWTIDRNPPHRYYSWRTVPTEFSAIANAYFFRSGNHRRHRLARLLYKKFIGPLAPTDHITYKDGNAANISLDNLAVQTTSQAQRPPGNTARWDTLYRHRKSTPHLRVVK